MTDNKVSADPSGSAAEPSVGAIILAAGLGSRMESSRPKVILPLEGRPLLRWVMDAALAAFCRPIITVVGHRAAEVMARVPAPAGVKYLVNHRYREGMGTSLAAGIRALAGHSEVEAAAVLLGDQPLIRGEHITALTRALAAGRAAAAPRGRANMPGAARAVFRGAPGHPVIIHRDLFGQLTDLAGDEGARRIIKSRPSIAVPFEDPGVTADVDRWSDYEAMSGGDAAVDADLTRGDSPGRRQGSGPGNPSGGRG